ncbi:MAG: MOSC domain-containing protein [Pseudomonadota bacterium]
MPSGFVKSRVDGPVGVTFLGLAGDEQADLTVHGGPEKAVYAYPAIHYAAWEGDLPGHAEKFVAGGLGENLTILGWTEADLCVGDVHAIGTARLQVCQPRQPCFKLALHFDDKLLPKAMIRTGRAGSYYRVIKEGVITAGDAVVLVDRPNPGFGFERLVEIVNFGNADRDELQAMVTMKGLASRIRTRSAQALGDCPADRA